MIRWTSPTRLFLAGVLVVGALSSSVEKGTYAYFTSAASSAGNQFSAGSIKLTGGIAVGDTLTMSNLVPGDSFTARLTLQDTGTLPIRYAMTTAVSGSAALVSALQLTVRTKTTNPCSSQDGTILYSGALASAAIGDPAHGAQPGDRVVSAGGTDELCFALLLPTTSTATLQETSATATFTFAGEQQ